MDKYQDFIDSIAPTAQKICKQFDLLPSVCIAQSILESNWGTQRIGAFNLFGRKAVDGDPAIMVKTWEEVNGEEVSILDSFKLYASLDEAITDYCILLTEEPCYLPALAFRHNVEEYVRAFTPFYATDSQYADKILTTIRANELTQYDEVSA